MGSVTQVDVMEEYQMLLVLANKGLYVLPLEALESNDNLLKRPKKIQGHANFFKSGVCMGRHLVCAAKMSGISTTIKVYEPTESNIKSKKKPAIPRMFQGQGESLRAFKVGIPLALDAVLFTNPGIRRSFMFPPNLHLLISYDLNCVWHVLGGSRLSAWRLLRLSHCWIMPIHR